MPQQNHARWCGDISVSYYQWSTKVLFKRLEPERHRTAGDIQQCRCTTEVSSLHNGGKCLQLLPVENHFLNIS
ncbi:hypothetical protein C7410_10422 [Paraburkholderia silvatlantica]|uniref:Uncharacterized protein n=1 Tax=Paraburkholderia silvatlantica TaxID=321895 RepID=A0A2V4TIY8_9BURK|nr:hypothetical protein C7410_10422 [Paraburkholderia silvatlantica]